MEYGSLRSRAWGLEWPPRSDGPSVSPLRIRSRIGKGEPQLSLLNLVSLDNIPPRPLVEIEGRRRKRRKKEKEESPNGTEWRL